MFARLCATGIVGISKTSCRYGVATEVRVMGDFDDWTMGVWLSCDSEAEDGTMVTFEGKLYVPPVRAHGLVCLRPTKGVYQHAFHE